MRLLSQPLELGLEVSRYTKYEPDWALEAPVEAEGVLVPRTHRFLPRCAQPHRLLSNVQLPAGVACAWETSTILAQKTAATLHIMRRVGS